MGQFAGSLDPIMADKIIVAPSLLAADLGRLTEAIELIEASCAAWIHFDVMDGIFVPNLTFGPRLVAALRPLSKKFFDVHLMLVEPERYIEDFFKAGADGLTLHWEALSEAVVCLKRIKALGLKAGISIVPSTPVRLLSDILPIVDLVLVMTVNPGFAGQKLIPDCLIKIEELAELRQKMGYNYILEVDGGINLTNYYHVLARGADVVVMGNGFFKSPNPLEVAKAIVAWTKDGRGKDV